MNFFKRWFEPQRSGEPDQSNDERSAPAASGGAGMMSAKDQATLALLSTVTDADPTNGEARLGLGMLLLRDFTREPAATTLHAAVQHLERAVAVLPESPDAHFYLALAHSYALDTLDEAAKHVAQALQLDPALADRAGEIQERIAAGQAGLQQQALDADTLRVAVQHYEQGQALAADGQPGAAVDAFVQAIVLYPAYAEALLALAEVYRQLGRGDEAMSTFRRALAVRPRLFAAHVGLGSLYVQRGNHARALEQLALALEQMPEQTQVLRNVGQLQLATRQPAAAAATFQRLSALQPNNPDSRLQLALAWLQAGDLAAARDSLRLVEGAQLTPKQQQLAAQLVVELEAAGSRS